MKRDSGNIPESCRPRRRSVPPRRRAAPLPRPGAALAAALVLSTAAACGGKPDDARQRPDSAPEASTASLPSARYLTLVAWTAPGGRPAGVLWLENRAGASDSLDRRYRGWSLDGDGPRRLLSVDDRLPVRAAAWRPLPAPGLRLSVDTRGRITALRVGGGEIRLRTERGLASWDGGRGQRQRLVGGRLRTAGDSAATDVTVALLRFEHLSGEPGPLGPDRTLLLAGGTEGGILVLDESPTRPWSRGWSWDADGTVRRLEAGALPDSARAGGPWRIAVPGQGMSPSRQWSVAAGRGPPSPDPGFVLAPATADIGRSEGASRPGGFLLRSPGDEAPRRGG